MKEVVLATSNAGKVKELANALQTFGLNIVAQSEFGVEDADETGTTFIENAIIKARHAAKQTGLPAIADDSGLEVDFLDGAPGVYSARFAGTQKSDADNIAKLLEALRDVPAEKRTARFHCALAYMRHAEDPAPILCHGTFEGTIAHAAAGEFGFGYDPVFYVEQYQSTAAQIAPQLKEQISHRAKALQQLFAALDALQVHKK